MWLFETKEGITTLVACSILAFLLLTVFIYVSIAHYLFILQMKRTKKTKWTRECSSKLPLHQ